jgi:hypothetical protein
MFATALAAARIRFLWPLHEAPVHRDLLLQNQRVVQRLLGGQRLFERLIFDQGVAFQETGSPVQIQMDVLDVSVVGELFVDVVLLGLLVDRCDEQDPALDR